MLAGFRRHLVGKTLRNACHCDIAKIRFVDKLMIIHGAEGPGFKSQPRRCRVTVLGKLFPPIVPLFTKQRNW